MATPKFKMLSQALEAPEEGITYPLGVSPEEQPGLFEEASDAALARENARLKEGYVPAGVGPVVEPSMDSPLAPMLSGLRSRKPVDFAPDTTKLQGQFAGFLGGNRSLQGPGFGRPLSDEELAAETERARKLMAEGDATSRDIPTVNASTRVDAPTTTVSTQPAVTSTSPAGPADSSGRANLPAPSSEGAGSDALGRLSIGQALTRALEGSGSIIAGRDLRSGAADTLGERMKQIEALRAKREEKALGDVEERSNLNAAIDSYRQLFPDQADALERLRGSTNKPAVLREQLNAWRQMMEWEKAKKPVAEARVEQMGAGTDLTQAKIPEVGLEGESKRLAREQATALGWARLNAQSAAAVARAAADVAKSGASATEQRAVDEQLGRIEKIIKGAGYTPLIASLEQADQAIAALGRPPTTGAQIKHSLPGGDRFLNPQEKAYFNSVDKLKQMEQLAISGKVVSVQEREEFIKEYGTDWYANPTAAAAYIDMLRKKTARQIDLDLASVRASPAGQLAIDAYAKVGGITSALPVFKGAGTVSAATGPTESQIAKLKARPDMAAEFDKKFGPGAAAKILGGP